MTTTRCSGSSSRDFAWATRKKGGADDHLRAPGPLPCGLEGEGETRAIKNGQKSVTKADVRLGAGSSRTAGSSACSGTRPRAEARNQRRSAKSSAATSELKRWLGLSETSAHTKSERSEGGHPKVRKIIAKSATALFAACWGGAALPLQARAGRAQDARAAEKPCSKGRNTKIGPQAAQVRKARWLAQRRRKAVGRPAERKAKAKEEERRTRQKEAAGARPGPFTHGSARDVWHSLRPQVATGATTGACCSRTTSTAFRATKKALRRPELAGPDPKELQAFRRWQKLQSRMAMEQIRAAGACQHEPEPTSDMGRIACKRAVVSHSTEARRWLKLGAPRRRSLATLCGIEERGGREPCSRSPKISRANARRTQKNTAERLAQQVARRKEGAQQHVQRSKDKEAGVKAEDPESSPPNSVEIEPCNGDAIEAQSPPRPRPGGHAQRQRRLEQGPQAGQAAGRISWRPSGRGSPRGKAEDGLQIW